MSTKSPPHLKPNAKHVAASGKEGKKHREILTTEMISLPVGDVRHTAHVGRGADDIFGDTAFLQQKSPTKKSDTFTRVSLRKSGIGKGSKKSRHGNATAHTMRPLSNQPYDDSFSLDSTNLQAATSMPMLNQQSATLKVFSEPNPSKKSKKTSTANEHGMAKSHETGLNCLPIASDGRVARERERPKKRRDKRIANSVADSDYSITSSTDVTETLTKSIGDDTDDTWTFNLDLGPSLLDEVLQALDGTPL